MNPKLPTLRNLTKELRERHNAWAHPFAGGEYVTLQWYPGEHYWLVDTLPRQCRPGLSCGREYIPGDGLPFDAVGAARRLLSDARASAA
jgi:hypothetical protein